MHNGIHKFGPFRLDTDEGLLQRGGVSVPVGQRALAILAALAEARGMVVSKDMLMAAGWPGVVVEEGNLTVQVAALRKALGDGEDWIVTVPRQGYRLRLEVPTAAPVLTRLRSRFSRSLSAMLHRASQFPRLTVVVDLP